jgi:hypothetical protein
VPFEDRIDRGFDALSPIMRAALEKSVRIRDKAPPTCRHLSLNGRNPILVVLFQSLQRNVSVDLEDMTPKEICERAAKGAH